MKLRSVKPHVLPAPRLYLLCVSPHRARRQTTSGTLSRKKNRRCSVCSLNTLQCMRSRPPLLVFMFRQRVSRGAKELRFPMCQSQRLHLMTVATRSTIREWGTIRRMECGRRTRCYHGEDARIRKVLKAYEGNSMWLSGRPPA